MENHKKIKNKNVYEQIQRFGSRLRVTPFLRQYF